MAITNPKVQDLRIRRQFQLREKSNRIFDLPDLECKSCKTRDDLYTSAIGDLLENFKS